MRRVKAVTTIGRIDALAASVRRDGWLQSHVSATDTDLRSVAEQLATQLGEPIKGRRRQVIESLAPTEEAGAHARSLSVAHGLGSFPMHTDGAHWALPPRFVVLMCVSPGTQPVPTTLLRFRDLRFSPTEQARLETAPLLVRNGKESFYSTICDASRPFVRFDQGCMMPQDAACEKVVEMMAYRVREMPCLAVHWQAGDFVVLDNWNVLHGRGLGDMKGSANRKLLRVSIR